MNDQVTADSILKWLKEQIEAREPIPPSKWLDSAAKLNVLLEDVDDKIATLKMNVNNGKFGFMEEGKTAAYAKAAVEAHDSYGALLRVEAKRDRIKEHIRIAKKRAELREWE